MLVYAEDLDTIEPVLVVDYHSLAFGKDRMVGGVPRDPEAVRDPSDREVPTDQFF